MKSKASAPGKVILFGEHFVVYGVKAILCAINKRITVTAEKIIDDKISIKSNIGSLTSYTKRPIDEIEFQLRPFYYIADKMIREHDETSGVKIDIESEIPLGVGLGSSSACCVAAAAAISRIFANNSREDILKLAIEAEKTIFPNTSGADCTVCLYGGIMQYDKHNGHSKIDSKPNFNLVIANSRIEHSTKEVVSKVKQYKEKNEEGFSQICAKESELIEQALVSIKNNNLEEIGSSITKNQEFLESIGVSNETLRSMVRLANETSFGAKITGAGGGGCIIALTDETNIDETIARLKKTDYECFSAKIDFSGLDTF